MKLLPSKFNGKNFQISAVRMGVRAYMDATPLNNTQEFGNGGNRFRLIFSNRHNSGEIQLKSFIFHI